MGAAEAIALAQALIAGLRTLIPEIRDLTAGGQVTAEQEQSLLNDIDALRKPGATTGPEWEQSGRTAQPAPGQQSQPQQQRQGNPSRR
jgi:hypothetical protein